MMSAYVVGLVLVAALNTRARLLRRCIDSGWSVPSSRSQVSSDWTYSCFSSSNRPSS